MCRKEKSFNFELRFVFRILLLLAFVASGIISYSQDYRIGKHYTTVKILNIKDSVFVNTVDSVIFCTECKLLKELDDARCFLVENERMPDNSPEWMITILQDYLPDVGIPPRPIKGIWEYKGYRFVFLDPVPKGLVEWTGKRKKIPVWVGYPMFKDYAEFHFSYKYGKMTHLRSLCINKTLHDKSRCMAWK